MKTIKNVFIQIAVVALILFATYPMAKVMCAAAPQLYGDACK